MKNLSKFGRAIIYFPFLSNYFTVVVDCVILISFNILDKTDACATVFVQNDSYCIKFMMEFDK